jgi:hypothetical protein
MSSDLQRKLEETQSQYAIARNVILSCPETRRYLPEGWQARTDLLPTLLQSSERCSRALMESLKELRQNKDDLFALVVQWSEAGKISKADILQYLEVSLNRP